MPSYSEEELAQMFGLEAPKPDAVARTLANLKAKAGGKKLTLSDKIAGIGELFKQYGISIADAVSRDLEVMGRSMRGRATPAQTVASFQRSYVLPTSGGSLAMAGKTVSPSVMRTGAGGSPQSPLKGKKYPMAKEGDWWGEGTYKQAGGRLEEMTPDEFLSRAKPLEVDDIARENIDDIKMHIESGRDLDPLTLYADDITDVRASDGRHRAIAAKELGIETVPVVNYVPAKSMSVADNLPMDEASRMARAREMGFDVDNPVYHGTVKDIQAFSNSARGSATKARSAKEAHWFSDDPEVAGGYAKYAAVDRPVQNLIDESTRLERMGKWDEAADVMSKAETLEQQMISSPQNGQNVMPVVLRNKNLMKVDAEGKTWGHLGDDVVIDWLKKAKREGFDGLEIKNFVDNADWGSGRAATHYAIFEPRGIRSTSAAFDPAKADSTNILSAGSDPSVAAAILQGQMNDE